MKKIAIPTGKGLHFVNSTDIILLEGDGNYTNIYVRQAQAPAQTVKYVACYPLCYFAPRLQTERFTRVCKKYIVALGYVTDVLKNHTVVMDFDFKGVIHVSSSYCKNLPELILKQDF